MAVPNQINSGNWKNTNILSYSGAGAYSYPFWEYGDSASFELTLRRTLDWSINWPYKPMSIINTRKGIAYLVERSAERDIGNGLVQWDEIYANVPATRIEPTSFIYSYDFLRQTEGSAEISSLIINTSAQVTYEYSLRPFYPLTAPKVQVMFGNEVYFFGGYGTYLPPGTYFLAEDAIPERYKGGIYMRKSIRVKNPNFKTAL